MLTLQRAQHWHRGAYLILSRGRGDASDGSDSLVAVNLSRPVRLSAHTDHDVVAQSHALHLALGAGAPPPSLLLGGPCHQAQPLCLLEICDAESLPVRGDVLRVPLQLLQPPGSTSLGVADDASTSLQVGAAQVAAAAQRQLRPLIAAELAVATAIVRGADIDGGGGRVLRAAVVQGCAIWSTMQLLSEMSRHQWGLCRAREGDVPFTTPISAAAAPTSVQGTFGTELEASSEEMIGEAEEGGKGQATDEAQLWLKCWRTRHPAFTGS